MSQSPSDPHAAADFLRRSDRAVARSARLIALSDAARARLGSIWVVEPSGIGDESRAHDETNASPTAQMERCHVFVVNHDPAFLDAVRVLLQNARYNVTSTNLVPQTFAMVHAAGADALVIDLTVGEPAIWGLVDQLSIDNQTKMLPVVLTSTDETLLERAERRAWPAGGRFHLLKPFDPATLADVIHALIGPA